MIAVHVARETARATPPTRSWSGQLVSLWDMLQDYLPFFKISRKPGKLRQQVTFRASLKIDSDDMLRHDLDEFKTLLESIQRKCTDFGLTSTAKLATRALARELPKTYAELGRELNIFNDALTGHFEDEALFRITPERKDFFEQDKLFGLDVSDAFRSCARDIQEAGSCLALERPDACVHHLMLVLERGLNALAVKVGVPYERVNWQVIIDRICAKLKVMPKSPEREFYQEVNATFGFLKVAYRNHSEHSRDDFYDLETALSILNHVCGFMQELAKGGLTE